MRPLWSDRVYKVNLCTFRVYRLILQQSEVYVSHFDDNTFLSSFYYLLIIK
jgi:hypothetical protein